MYDIAFSRAGGGRDMFASVGADGSVRMFDLRCVFCFLSLLIEWYMLPCFAGNCHFMMYTGYMYCMSCCGGTLNIARSFILEKNVHFCTLNYS